MGNDRRNIVLDDRDRNFFLMQQGELPSILQLKDKKGRAN